MAALKLEVRGKGFPAAGKGPARRVLEGVRMGLAPGERVALVGPSGCGKTTLLNIVAGLDRDFSGRVELPPGARLAYVFQEPRLLPWRSVADNLRLVLPEGPEREARVAAALEEVGLAEAAGVFASRLSLGMARRVALARAFVTEPTLLLLDEPFVSLDEPTAQRLRLLLLDLLKRHGGSALFVSHALHEAVMVADRLVVLGGGPPARVRAELPVPLVAEDRRVPALVDAFRTRLAAGEAALAELLLPAAAGPVRPEEVAPP